MMHIIEITPTRGMKYLAGFTESEELAKSMEEKILAIPDIGKVKRFQLGLQFPFNIVEIKNGFRYFPKFDPETTEDPEYKGASYTLYLIDREWFPSNTGKDEMGMLNHDHIGDDGWEDVEGMND